MLAPFLVVLATTLLCLVGGFTIPELWILMFLGAGEMTLSFYKIRENERVVPIFLGKICPSMGSNLTEEEKAEGQIRRGLFGTGLAFFLWPFYEVRRYPTTVQQIIVKVGKVTTRPGEAFILKDPAQPPAGDNVLERRKLGPAELEIELAVNFQWNLENLESAVKYLPAPTEASGKKVSPELEAILTKEIDDATKTAAAPRTWYDIYFDRRQMESAIEDVVLNLNQQADRDSSFVKGGITERRYLRIAIDVVKLPDTLSTSINAEQEALFKADATRRKAEGDRYAKEQEGEGEKTFRRLVYEVTRGAHRGEFEQNRVTEALRSLVALGQSPSKTLFAIPPILTDVFGQDKAELLVGMLSAANPQQRRAMIQDLFGFPARGQGGRQQPPGGPAGAGT